MIYFIMMCLETSLIELMIGSRSYPIELCFQDIYFHDILAKTIYVVDTSTGTACANYSPLTGKELDELEVRR